LASLFLILAITVPIVVNKSVQDGVFSAIKLDSPTQEPYKVFVNNSQYPISLSCYVLNITNSNDVLTNGSKPIVQEVGPYVYKMYRMAFNTSFSQDYNELSYKYYQYYVFDPSRSVGNDTTAMVTSLNMVFWGLAAALRHKGDSGILTLLYEQFTTTSEYDRVFVKRSVNQILFGYADDPVLQIANSFNPQISKVYDGLIVNHTSFEDAAKRTPAPDTIFTGRTDPRQTKQYKLWKGNAFVKTCPVPPCPTNPEIDAWGTQDAGKIVGSDGGQLPPPVSSSDTPTVFMAQLYRSVQLQFAKESTYNGIDILQFVFDKNLYSNNATYGPNANYFQYGPNGLGNVTSCANYIPFFPSNPRFEGVDHSVAAALTYINAPGVVDTSSYFDIEPNSGLAVHISLSTMASTFVGPLAGQPIPNNDTHTSTWFPSLPRTFMPLLWAKNEAGLEEAEARSFGGAISAAKAITSISQGVGYTGFCLLVLFALIAAFNSCGYGHNSYFVTEDKSLLYNPYASTAASKSSHEEDEYQIMKGNASVSLHSVDRSTGYGSSS
jgi:hypothetical protein